ncbi:MAG TPA: hypothetical protein VFL83_13500 [Anaeromyxobacter sp.]|nr:hypothetical protein [Anaeromyxobacter sp.]
MTDLADLWFAVALLAASGVAVWQGARIALRRRIENPFLSATGGKALAVGLGVLALGLVGALVAVLEGLRLRAG